MSKSECRSNDEHWNNSADRSNRRCMHDNGHLSDRGHRINNGLR